MLLVEDRVRRRVPSVKRAEIESEIPTLSQEELKAARKKFEEEMDAFQDLMNYNADVAYGTADAALLHEEV